MSGAAKTPRNWYAATVLTGLSGAVLAAVAGKATWAEATGQSAGISVHAAVDGSDAAPLATALALVALAAWGVVLVSRGTLRRFVAGAGALATAGVLAAVVDGWTSTQTAALEALSAQQMTGDVVETSMTAWYYLTGVGGVLTLAGFAVAVVLSPRWPAMGSRYDAPAAQAEQSVTEQDMWRALDQGHDPTS